MMGFPLHLAQQQFPDAVAFRCVGGSVTYQQLAAQVSQRAASLAERGVSAGQHVIWIPSNDLETLVCFWSLLSLGSVSCPISPRYPEAEKVRIQSLLNATWLHEAGRSSSLSNRSFLNREAATVTLSSGSTGTPKPCVHTLSAHVASAVGAANRIPLRPGDVWLWSLPLYHVSGLSIPIRCAVSGAAVAGLQPSQSISPDLLRELRVTHLSVVPTQLHRLLESVDFPTPELKAVLVGGSQIPPSLVSEARRRGAAVHTTYGLTEMASQVTTSSATGDEQASGELLPGRELEISSDGEILVRGDTLCLGYWHDGKLSPATDDDGWFHTKDRGFVDEDAQLHVLGRLDNQFISGGENIYPEAIERALMSLPSIRQAIVVPRSDAEFGYRPVAFVDGDHNSMPSWQESLATMLRRFEIPVAYFPWPTDLDVSVKLRRADLIQRVEQQADD